MTKLTFVSQSSRVEDAAGYSSERLINCYGEMGPQGAKGPLLIRSVLGRASFADTSTPVFRAMEYLNGKIYAAGGGRLWSIDSAGTVSNLEAIADDAVTTISSNGTDITVCAGKNYYLWDGTTISQPGSGRFSDEGTVEHLDHYTIITESDGDEFEWTTLNDASTRDATYFATNESHNDDTLRVMVHRLYAYFLGEERTEIWYNSGESGADAFKRLSGGVLDTGLLAANLVTKTETGLFLVGNDKIAYLLQGGEFRAISTPPVNYDIDANDPTHCFYYEDRGHRFCCIRWDDRPAWVYDMSTGLWHERSTGVAEGAWDVIATAGAFGKWYCANSSGVIYEFSRVNTDVTDPLMRRMVSRNIDLGGVQFSVAELELLGNFGDTALGQDVQIMFKLSGDSGRTWGPEIMLPAGDTGDYALRVVLRALGTYRNFAVQVTITDADDINIYSQANVRIS